MDAASRRAELERLSAEWGSCTRCPLSEGRTQVVVGSGDPDADLMFVGEAPGFHEDKQGVPFVGQAGKLLETLLGEIGLTREAVYIANVIKCRPPGNRDPLPDEIEACEGYLFSQVELIRAEGDLHARQLRHQAPVGPARGHHPRPRPAPGAADRQRRTCSSSRSTTRRPRSTRRPC